MELANTTRKTFVGTRLFLAGFILCLASLIACSRSYDREELYGTYIADYQFAKEKLVLNKDGTFTQEIQLKTKPEVNIRKGKWWYSTEGRSIHFDDQFMIVCDGWGRFIAKKDRPHFAAVICPVVGLTSIRIEVVHDCVEHWKQK